MAGFQVSVLIERPPEEVFNYLSTLDNEPKWLPGVTRVEKLTEGPTSVGTRYREVRLRRSGEGQVEMQVTAYEPPQRYSTAFHQGGYEGTYHYTLEPEESGTRVHLRVVISGHGLGKLMLPLAVWAIKRQDEPQLRSLKEAMDDLQ